jgi:hypothetical protein
VHFKLRLFTVALLAYAVTLTQSSAATSAGRFGYLLPSVRNVQLANIPQRDRYAKGIAESIAAAGSITAVAIPKHTASGLDLQALCKAMDLVGFIDPYVGWMANEDTVSAQATANVMDCHGKPFYSGQASDVAKFDAGASTEPQVDARMILATARLTTRFVDFTKGNADGWNTLRSGAPAARLSASEAVLAPIKALADCTTFFTTKRYVEAIAACNDADVETNIAPSVTKMMQQTPHADDASSYVALFGLMIAGSYCVQAQAHYQLAERTAGLTQAKACASWLKRLIAFIEPAKGKAANPKLQAVDVQLKSLRLVLENHFPEVINQ